MKSTSSLLESGEQRYIKAIIVDISKWTLSLGVGIAQWLERRTHDWKVVGSNPCRRGGRIFFSRVHFLCWIWFQYPTLCYRSSPSHSAKSAGGRFHLNTHAPYIYGFAWSDMMHGCMVYTERAEMAAVSCGTSLIYSCKYTTSVDIQKHARKS